MALLFNVQDHIAKLTLNRPEVMNAMDPETYDQLSKAWIEVRDSPVPPTGPSRPAAMDYAQRLCQSAPLALRAIKELAVRSQYMDIADGIRLESAIGRALGETEDAREGRLPFAEKRPAQFEGR